MHKRVSDKSEICETCRYFSLKMFQANGKCSLECKCVHPGTPDKETSPKSTCENWMKIDPTIEV